MWAGHQGTSIANAATVLEMTAAAALMTVRRSSCVGHGMAWRGAIIERVPAMTTGAAGSVYETSCSAELDVAASIRPRWRDLVEDT